MTSTVLGLLSGVGPFSLLLLVAVAFAETGLLAGFLVPGDTVVFGGGVLLAGGVLHLALWPSIAAIAAAAVAGDQVGYLVGRRAGPWLVRRPGRRLSARHLENAAAFVDRHGPRAVLLARFVPLARTMTPVVAGMGRMPRRRFTAYNVIGAIAWTVLTFGGGYWFGAVPFVAAHLTLLAVAIACLSVSPVAVPVAARLWRSRHAPGSHSAHTGFTHVPIRQDRDGTAYAPADPAGAPMSDQATHRRAGVLAAPVTR